MDDRFLVRARLTLQLKRDLFAELARNGMMFQTWLAQAAEDWLSKVDKQPKRVVLTATKEEDAVR